MKIVMALFAILPLPFPGFSIYEVEAYLTEFFAFLWIQAEAAGSW